jgi:hypothetical protein
VTITDIKTRQRAAAEKAGGAWWFAPRTMRMFCCRVVSRVYSRGRVHFFVTAGRMHRDDPERFSVRMWLEDTPERVWTFGSTNYWAFLASARDAARRAARIPAS